MLSLIRSAFYLFLFSLLIPYSGISSGAAELAVGSPGSFHDIVVAPTRAPFSAVMVFDASGSMQGANLDSSKSGGHAFINRMSSDDQAAIMAFGSTVTMHASFTSAKPTLHVAVDSIKLMGATALWDALYLASNLLVSAVHPDRFIVVISDGGDGSSTRNMAEVVATAKANNVHIISIGLGPNANLSQLESLSSQTGGRSFALQDPIMLPSLMAGLVDSLVTDVTPSYVPYTMNVSVFPQPGNGGITFRVTLERASTMTLELHDQLGRSLFYSNSDIKSTEHTCTIDARNYPQGIYFAAIRTGARQVITKVIIAR